MHCPTCGKPATVDQQFCRNCGMNLETVSTLVARHTSAPTDGLTIDQPIQKKVDKAACERAIVSRMFNWIMWGIIVIGLGVVMMVFRKSGLVEFGKWFHLLSSLTMLSGVGLAMAGLLKGMKDGVQLPGRRPPIELAEPAETKTLPTNPFPEALPSVTERTTQLISHPKQ